MTTRYARPLARLSLILLLTGGLGACQTMADLDPTGLLSDDSATSDANSAAASPELANIPGAPTTTDDQKDVASSLNAAGAQAQYSGDALRAGTEAAAPPPVAASSAPVVQQALNAAPPSPATDVPPTVAAPAPTASDLPPTTDTAAAPAAVAPARAPVQTASVAPPIPVTSAAPAAPAPVQTAALPPETATPPGAEPAVPAVPPAGAVRGTTIAAPAMSDAALGFRPSSAPPLDPSVSNFVSQPILARYRQTASAAPSFTTSAAAVPGQGTVIASNAGSAISAIASANGGVAPAAVIYFPGDGTTLNAAARVQVRAAVAAFKAGGGTGMVRVVGHASSRTANMPVEKHLEVIFEKSQKRATAVMQELVHQGVPADHVQIDAVGDSQPVYYESMPKGEDGNRRAEIYLQ